MVASLDRRLALDPGLCLKNDVDRVILITRPPPLADRDYICRLLHPSEAIILALMDGNRTLLEVAGLWAQLTLKTPDAAREEILAVGRYFTTGDRAEDRILIEPTATTEIRRYDPWDYIIPEDSVNLRERRLRLPYMVYYLPTLFCPQNCTYCYARTRSKLEPNLLRLERLREIFAELASIGVESIQMSGGDVLARPDILGVVASIMDAGLLPDISTKMEVSFGRAKALRAWGVKVIQFSLDSPDPEILDRMVGVPNYHPSAFRTLQNLKRAGLTVRVNAVITPINMATVAALVRFLGRLGNVTRLALSPYGRSLFCHRDELFVAPDEMAVVVEEMRKSTPEFPHMTVTVGAGAGPEPAGEEERRLQWRERAFCTANRDGFVILPDGQVTVCEELYDHPAFIIGDLTTQSVVEMWNSPAALALMWPEQSDVPDGPCRECAEFVQCNAVRGRCWRDILKSYGWNKPHYPDPRCPVAPPGRRLG